MFTLAKLVFKSYMPKQLEKGMWFVSKQKDVVYGRIYEYLQLHELTHTPQDMESYIAFNGAPVEPYIVMPTQNKDDKEEILATPDQIGWWDQGDTADDLEDLTVQIINAYVYGEDGENGDIALEVFDSEDEEGIHRNVVFFHDKVTIRHVSFVDEHEYEDDEDDEDYPTEHPDDYEDWDEMDDLTEYDPEPNDADHETE